MKQNNKYKHSTIKNTKFIDSESLYERFVNKNSVLVKIHDNVDFSFVNELCDDVYSEDGQRAWLPELVFKVHFVKMFVGGLSDNEVVRQCRVNMEYRYFLDLAVDDDLFDDCKLSRFRKELGAQRFKQIFDQVVEKIKDAGLISESDAQYMDSFLLLADVKVISVNALLSKALREVLQALGKEHKTVEEDAKRRDFELSEEQQKQRFVFLVKKAQSVLALAAKRDDLSSEAKDALRILALIVKQRSEVLPDGAVRKKKSKEEKNKIVNLSDPDARMMGKKNTPIAPSYKSHVSMNKDGFITYTDATLATVYDGHQQREAIFDLKGRDYKVPQCVGDTHYGDIDLRKEMGPKGTQIIAPYRENQVMNSCMTQDVMIEAWAYNHTKEYKEHMKKRAQVEPKQGEMKNLHGMRRALLRGLNNIRILNYISAIATNLKKFVNTLAKAPG